MQYDKGYRMQGIRQGDKYKQGGMKYGLKFEGTWQLHRRGEQKPSASAYGTRARRRRRRRRWWGRGRIASSLDGLEFLFDVLDGDCVGGCLCSRGLGRHLLSPGWGRIRFNISFVWFCFAGWFRLDISCFSKFPGLSELIFTVLFPDFLLWTSDLKNQFG